MKSPLKYQCLDWLPINLSFSSATVLEFSHAKGEVCQQLHKQTQVSCKSISLSSEGNATVIFSHFLNL